MKAPPRRAKHNPQVGCKSTEQEPLFFEWELLPGDHIYAPAARPHEPPDLEADGANREATA